MRRSLMSLAVFSCIIGFSTPASAHFQEIIPSADVLEDGGSVSLNLIFTHPFEGAPVMQMKKPVRLGVLDQGKNVDLLPRIAEKPVDGKEAWTVSYDLAEPDAAIFYVEPQPYWEPAEGRYIVHYAKVVVDNYAFGEGWDELVGLPVEIQPLTRPTRYLDGQRLFRRPSEGR